MLSFWLGNRDFFGALRLRLANARYPRALQPFTERLQFAIRQTALVRILFSIIVFLNLSVLTGYSAPLDFSTIPNGCEKSALLETAQSAKPIAPLRLLRRTLRVLTPIHRQEKTKHTKRCALFFGWGIGIRTPTNRVRVCRATVTQFPNI